MNSVFHACVPLAPGTTSLLTVEQLAAVDPQAHREAIAKYDDTPERRRLRDTVIPRMHLRWTDVVFLLPVHPHAIWSAWKEIRGRERAPMEFWAIPASELPDGTVVLDRSLTATGDPIDPREVTPFERDAYRTSLTTTSANRAWLEECVKRKVSGAWFHGIPHVLAPGPVPLNHAEVISWDKPYRTGR